MRTRSLGALSTAAVLSLALLLGVACGGGGGGGDDGGGGGGGDTGGGADVAAPDGGGGSDAIGGDDTGGPAGDLVLELFGMEPETTALTESTLTVRTRVYDADALTPVSGVRIDYALEVVTPPDVGAADGALLESTALTDSQGTAGVDFSVGAGAGAVYRITATAEGVADPVTLTVTVASQPTGAIHVTFDYEGDEAPTDVVVLLLMDVFPCDGFNPGAPPATPFQDQVPFTAGEWTSGDLQQSPNWNVLLIGLDAAGSVVAGGCTAGVRVVADVTAQAEVTMTPVGLHLPGTYDWTATVDLAAAGPADAGTLTTTIETLFENPRAGMTEVLGAAIGEELTAADPEGECIGLWEADLPGVVEAAVPETAAWTGAFAGLAEKLAAALRAVTLEADLTVSGLPPGPYDGDLTWRAISVSFDGGTVRWEPADFGAVVYPIRLEDETTTWTARVDGYDDLVVEAHDMVLEPGRLAAALVTDEVLAGAPGTPGTIEDVALAFFDCPAIGAGLSGEVTACLADEQIAVEDVVATCEELVREHMAPATALLEGWVTPSVMLALTGTGTVVDADQDLGVDRVDDGALAGTITVDAAETPVEGTFTMTHTAP